MRSPDAAGAAYAEQIASSGPRARIREIINLIWPKQFEKNKRMQLLRNVMDGDDEDDLVSSAFAASGRLRTCHDVL